MAAHWPEARADLNLHCGHRSSKDWPATIAEATETFEYLEQQDKGLASLFEAAIDLATAYSLSGDWASAEALFEQCWQVRDAVCGPTSRETATAIQTEDVVRIAR